MMPLNLQASCLEGEGGSEKNKYYAAAVLVNAKKYVGSHNVYQYVHSLIS